MATTTRQQYLDDWKQKGLVSIKEICANCLRHSQSSSNIHPDGGRCIRCLPPTITATRRCKACKVSFYCTQECQTAHWDKHRKFCTHMVAMAGQDMERARADAFNDSWCERPEIEVAAKSAVHYAAASPGDGTVFLVEADADVTFSPPSAPRCVSRAQIRAVLTDVLLEPDVDDVDGGVEAHLRRAERQLVAPGVMGGGAVPVVALDRGARYPHNICVLHIKADAAPGEVHEDWLDRFKRDARD
ncbi:hypothetical protein BV25DRAFT_1368699 [Artomyces pyxidatus]|uniref:Uncharacterized protein n=1 Tax=Artomyces pyxidatus TaxID=48021 RepID=A0ACB8SNZ4_9AGAM|nr:hypothetical protein BV25DRAFT_1368699 [Artomyces pyxidatus]